MSHEHGGQPRTTLAEVEVSVTEVCSLACAHCGFVVPNQPQPFTDPVQDIRAMLETLDRLRFDIGSLAILGGEATLAKKVLRDVLGVASSAPNVLRVELVTNGLTPGGLLSEGLPHVDRLSLSDYTNDPELADAWQEWLMRRAPHIEFVRRQHDGWDRWDDPVDMGGEGGQAAYEACWYRRHCITLERGRIFICSRIPKLSQDEQGLTLNGHTARQEVLDYLSAPQAPAACRHCTPMAGLEKVAPGVQPDERLVRLRAHALGWFATRGA